MIEQVNPPERQMPVSPALALRVAILGGVALVLFTVLFFRLWYLQILTGNQYRATANTNSTRTLPIPAPRGAILDSAGAVIADDQQTDAVQIEPAQLPAQAAERMALYDRLGRVVHLSGPHIAKLVAIQHTANPFANVTVAVDTGYGILTYLSEHQQLYPGVTEGQLPQRDYVTGDVLGQTIGFVSLINSQEQGSAAYKGIAPGTIIGQYGLEGQYDQFLRGAAGVQHVEVDASGNYVKTKGATAPTPGEDLRTTINLPLEEEGDRAMADGFAAAAALGYPAYDGGGAYVAIDPIDGSIYAMGSFPGFDPNIFNHTVTDAEWSQLVGSATDPGPLFNRAIGSTYPTGSTFKPIAAMAALEAGVITPSTQMGAGSCVAIGLDHQKFCNANNENLGDLDVEQALAKSEDTFFYEVGAEANDRPHQLIQSMARYLGLGRTTGIDLPGEATGVIPDAAWRRLMARRQLQCEQTAVSRHQSPGTCQISNGALWTIGDNVLLAVGQGDLQASVLQMAVVYSALANAYENGGHGVVPVPHLAKEIDTPQGALVQQLPDPPGRPIVLDAGDLDVVMAGLHDATTEAGGTSADVWAGFPRPVYGKTGTAQHGVGQSPQAWYVCYLPSKTKPIVIAVTIEKGGYGDESAAPVARLIASKWFNLPLKLTHGSSPDQ